MQDYSNIYAYITAEEAAFELPVPWIDGRKWSMKEHIRTTVLYKNSKYVIEDGTERPFKNIIRPILNVQYRNEDIDVKDVVLYVNDSDKYHLSFLVKKYHDDVYVVEHDLDTFFDQVKESKIDFGGGLSQYFNSPRPEWVPLESIAFCDQTNILAGPICLRHYMSPDEVKGMEDRHWGDSNFGATHTVDDVIAAAKNSKVNDKRKGQEAKTPGKNIEIYEIHGTLPENFLNPVADPSNTKWIRQVQIVTFYYDEHGDKQGMTLFRTKEDGLKFKLAERDAIFGRGLGMGGAEELFESQVWENDSVIRVHEILAAVSKIIWQTADKSIATRNNLKDLEQNEIIYYDKDKGGLEQVDTSPRNLVLFENAMQNWEMHAQKTGFANDPLLGKSPSAGTPFKLENAVIMEGRSIHEYRRGKYAKHIEEIYKDWILPHIKKEILKGSKFLSDLSPEEMRYVAECLVRNEAAKYERELVLQGKKVDPAKTEEFRQKVRKEFMQGGSKRFLEVLAGEFENISITVKVNVSGKQKDLSGITDKLTNLFSRIFANPDGFKATMQIPAAAKVFNELLEYSGLSPVDFDMSYLPPPQAAQPALPNPNEAAAPAGGGAPAALPIAA